MGWIYASMDISSFEKVLKGLDILAKFFVVVVIGLVAVPKLELPKKCIFRN